jgi:hypothetical protein
MSAGRLSYMQIILFPVNPDDIIPFGFVVNKVVLGWVLLGVLQFFISTTSLT